jgi:hypothetical protein
MKYKQMADIYKKQMVQTL